MNAKQLKNDLMKNIAQYLIQYGFDGKVRKGSFWKKVDCGKVMISMGFVNHSDDFDVLVGASVRFDQLEDMIHETLDLKLLKESEKKKRCRLVEPWAIFVEMVNKDGQFIQRMI